MKHVKKLLALFLIMRFVLGRIEARQHELPLVR